MIATIIGISLGLLTILTISMLKNFDKPTIYGLILAAIGFLYVGFSWMDIPSLIVNIVQALFFLFLAYFGIKRNIYFLISGYFLHGSWDLLYSLFPGSALIPPHYDLFCWSIDFTIGIYLAGIEYRKSGNLFFQKHKLPGKK